MCQWAEWATIPLQSYWTRLGVVAGQSPSCVLFLNAHCHVVISTAWYQDHLLSICNTRYCIQYFASRCQKSMTDQTSWNSACTSNRRQLSYLTWSCFAVWTKKDGSVSLSTSWAYPTRPLFSRSPWYSSACACNFSSLKFLEASIALRAADFFSSRIWDNFSKLWDASSLALSLLH